jgi:hypothetical protein
MSAIADGIGSGYSPAPLATRRDLTPSAPARLDLGGVGTGTSGLGDGAYAPAGELGRLYQSSSHRWADAVKTRQTDQQLGQLSAKILDTHYELTQVKLYPPYPVDEPRRAAAIRQFNGVAAEVARLVPQQKLSPLPEQASTAQASNALDALERARTAVDAKRTELVRQALGTERQPSDHEAEQQAQDVRAELEHTEESGIARAQSTLLRQLS